MGKGLLVGIGRMHMKKGCFNGGRFAGGFRPHRFQCSRIRVGFGPGGGGGLGGGAPNQEKPDLEWVRIL